VDRLKVDDIDMRGVKLTPARLKSYDCAVVVADHSEFDYGMIVRNSKAIVDTRNALGKYKGRKIRRI
jgi:UDP-N-acetyl-D-glucosamine dehydrogenase